MCACVHLSMAIRRCYFGESADAVPSSEAFFDVVVRFVAQVMKRHAALISMLCMVSTMLLSSDWTLRGRALRLLS
jgi:hypothetical protein